MLRVRSRTLAGWLAVILVLVWFQGAAVLESFRMTLYSASTNGDALQQIFPFFRYVKPTAFANDYIADYYIACYPVGYWGLYASFAKLGGDPTELSRVLPHVTWLAAVILLGAAANKLGGKLAALCAMALALGGTAFLYRTAGGLPRAFGFPILAGTLASLAYGRVGWCAICVLLGAMFYPVSAVISGLSLAGMLLFPKIMGLKERSWGFFWRVGFLACTAVLAAAILLPSALSSSRYGELVTPHDVRAYPEAGRGGRYDSDSRPPFKGFLAEVSGATERVLWGRAPAWSQAGRAWIGRKGANRYDKVMDGLFYVGLLGAASMLVRRPAARRVLMLGVASGIGHTLARSVAPYAYLPERYAAYTVPLLLTLGVSTAIAGLFPASYNVGWRRWPRRIAVACYVTAVLWLLAGRIPVGTGLGINLNAWKPLTRTITALPLDSLVAGWPDGAMNRIPHATRHRVLITHEVHQAFHTEYIKEMRRRMNMLIDAYFATSADPILALRDELGVTHLLIERAHFEPASRLSYFRPFNKAIAEQREAAKGKSYELPRRIRQASIVSFKDYELLDLSRITEEPVAEGEAEPPPPRHRKRKRAR